MEWSKFKNNFIQSMEYLKKIAQVILILIFLDIAILGFMVIGITSGEKIEHIPFWDAQLQFVFGK